MSNAQYIPGIAELGRKNQPGGYVGIDNAGVVLGSFQQRVDTEANLSSLVLLSGELAYASDTQSWFMGDGVTAGGVFQYAKPQFYSKVLNSVVTPPAPGTATSSNSILLPPLPSGAIRNMKIFATLYGDTSNTSNIAIVVNAQKQFENLAGVAFTAAQVENRWYDGISNLLLTAQMQKHTRTVYAIRLEAPTGFHNKSDLKLVSEIVVASSPSNQPDYPLAVQVISRDGVSAAGSGNIYIVSQRIA